VILAEFDDPAEAAAVVLGDIGFVSGDADFELVGASTRRARIYIGLAGWGAGQLEDELSGDDWIVAPALERIAKQARRIVFLSNLTVRDDIEEQAYPVTTLHAKIERLIEVSGVRWTFLRPGALAANARMWWAPQVRAGDIVRWPYPGAVTSPIHERDIAAVAVRALCEDRHAGAKYILTGPQSLTQRDQVHIIGDAIGRPLRFEEIPPEAARRELVNMMPTSIADMLIDAWQNVEYGGAGTVGKPAPVTSTVAEITGVPARSFHDWVVDHAVEFQQ